MKEKKRNYDQDGCAFGGGNRKCIKRWMDGI